MVVKKHSVRRVIVSARKSKGTRGVLKKYAAGRAGASVVNAARRENKNKRGKHTVMDIQPEIVERRSILGEEVKTLLESSFFFEFVSKNVGSHANNILKTLCFRPETDEKIAETLELKLNETRRVLNVLNGYGVVRYNVNRDTKGWLTFEWYIDNASLCEFGKTVSNGADKKTSNLPRDCNDFFICGFCFKKHKMLLPFDVAVECAFRCGCGGPLRRLGREEAELMLEAR